MKVIYNGVDIYPDVSVGRCWHDMHAWGAMDSLTIDFGDTRNVWDSWGPAEGDVIEVEDGPARTGKMYVGSVVPASSKMTIRAFSAPSQSREARCSSWESVRLLQLVSEIAGRSGLEWESYGLENHLYDYVEQDNETDMSFLDRRLSLEGASMVVFDGKLIAYSGLWAESQDASGSLDIVPGVDYEFRDESSRSFGSCTVTDGTTSAKFSYGDGRELRIVLSERISSLAEAERFAKGLLRKANRESSRLVLKTDTMLRGYAAGSVVNLSAPAAMSWSGKAFVYAMRHDYYDSKCKIWLSRPLGGY